MITDPVALKDFLADRPEYAFLAFTLLTIGILWRALRRSEVEKLEIALRVIPLADKLQAMLQRLAEKRHRAPPSGGQE